MMKAGRPRFDGRDDRPGWSTRIVTVDVEKPLPSLHADSHYSDAWVVLRRTDIPGPRA